MKAFKYAITVMALTLSPLAASSIQYQELSNELEIMNSVLATTLKQHNREEAIRFRGLESSYLASQGIVFNVLTSRSSGGLNFALREFIPAAPPAPAAPIVIGGNGRSIEIDIHEGLGHIIEDTLRHVENAFRESNEQLRDVRDESRELAWEMREYERRMRDLNFEMRNADANRKSEIEQQINELKTEIAQLQQRQTELTEYADTLETEQKDQLKQQQEAYQQVNKAFLAAFEERIADTLCRYGAGLRALPENEHVSFVLKKFYTHEQNKTQDRIYVFKQSDVKQCVQEKLDSVSLLAGAVVYEF